MIVFWRGEKAVTDSRATSSYKNGKCIIQCRVCCKKSRVVAFSIVRAQTGSRLDRGLGRTVHTDSHANDPQQLPGSRATVDFSSVLDGQRHPCAHTYIHIFSYLPLGGRVRQALSHSAPPCLPRLPFLDREGRASERRASEVTSYKTKTTVPNIGGTGKRTPIINLTGKRIPNICWTRTRIPSILWEREENKLRRLSMIARHPSLFGALLKDASTLINKMKHNLNTGDMRLIK